MSNVDINSYGNSNINIKALEILEKGILNKYTIVLDEDNEPHVKEIQGLEDIANSNIIERYFRLKKQKIDKYIKNNKLLALKLNHINNKEQNIQPFLSNKDSLADILFILLELESAGFILKEDEILRKDNILNKTKIKKIDLEKYIYTDHKGLFVFLENASSKKASNEFLISPFLLNILEIFKEKMKYEYKKELEENEKEE